MASGKKNIGEVVDKLNAILNALNGMTPKGKTRHGRGSSGTTPLIEDLIDSYSGNDSKYTNLKEKVSDYRRLRDEGKGKKGGEAATKNAKAAIMSMVGDEIITAVRDTLQLFTKGFSAYYEIQKTNIKAEKQIMSKRLELYGDALKKGADNMVTILTGDLTEAIYTSLNNNLDFGLQEMNKRIEMRQINYDRAVQIQMTNLNALNDTVGNALGVAGKNFSSSGAPWAVVVGTVLSTAQEIMRATTEVQIEKLKAEQEIITQANDFRKEYNEKMFGLAETQIKLGENVDKMLMAVDKSAYEMARGLGLGAQAMINYKNAVLSANLQIAELGKSWEDMIKIQQAYIETSDRNLLMTGENAARTSAIGMLFGIGDTESGAIMGAMNVFNKSIDSGSNMMFQMYKTATRMGVSNQKFAKDLQNTLKLSQRYQFKDGVKGVMEMALWAQKVRMNINDMESALSRIHTGNIEDVLQTSARLNVLGGNAALLSDPMALLFNAYADPKKYMENINRMVKGFGTVNRRSGETTFSIAEQMRIEQIANATGTSVESLMNQARQANKAEVIKRRFGNRFGEATDYVTNNATWDEKKGTFVVNVLGEDGKAHERRLEELRKEEIEKIFPEDKQDQLLTYVSSMLSIMEEQHKYENLMRGALMSETSDEHGAMHRGSYKAMYEEAMEDFDWHKQNVLDVYGIAEESTKNQLALNKKMREEYDKTNQTLVKMVGEMSSKAFRENIGEFTDMIAAFSSEEAFMGYLKKHSPELYAAINKAGSVNLNEFENKYGERKKLSHVTTSTYNEEANYTPEEIVKMAEIIGKSVGEMKSDLTAGKYYYDKERGLMYTRRGFVEGIVNKQAFDSFKEAVTDKKTGQVLPKSQWNKTWMEKHPKERFDLPNQKEEPWLPTDYTLTGYRSVHDAIITPRGMVYTHPDDTIMAFKPNGPIMNGMNSGNGGNTRLEVSGTLRLDTGNQSVDLMKLIKDNPYEFGNLVASVLEKTKYGGRSKHAASWNMLNNIG